MRFLNLPHSNETTACRKVTFSHSSFIPLAYENIALKSFQPNISLIRINVSWLFMVQENQDDKRTKNWKIGDGLTNIKYWLMK